MNSFFPGIYRPPRCDKYRVDFEGELRLREVARGDVLMAVVICREFRRDIKSVIRICGVLRLQEFFF